MKAIIHKKYGNVNNIQCIDTEKPQVQDNSVLVRVKASSINAMDIHILEGKPFPLRFFTGLLKPKYPILGADFSGVVEEVGKEIKDFNVDQEVFGTAAVKQNGSFAEYVVVSEKQITSKHKDTSFEEAATLPIAGISALQALRNSKVSKGSKVLIYGASGGVGTFAIQIAKAMNAHVSVVCSTRNIDVAKMSGADVIYDYKKVHWYDESTEKYDAIIGVNGYTHLRTYRNFLTEEGIYVMIGGTTRQLLQMYILKPFLKKGKRQFQGFLARINRPDLEILSEMLGKGQIKPYIDYKFDLKDAKKALEHYIGGNTIGKTVIKM